jgi:glycopeptide antibiotics resistance protein
MILDTLTDAIIDIWPMLIIFLVVIITIRLSYIKINGERFVFYHEFLNLIFIIYILLLYQLLTSTELNANSGLNLVPFTEIFRYKIGSTLFTYNVIGNILIFVPFGYFVSGYVKASKVSHILFISLITSLTVELVQLHIGRSFDIDDIILNVSGSIIGFLLYIGLTAIKKHLPRFFRTDTFYNIICIVLLIVVFVYFTRIIGLGWF